MMYPFIYDSKEQTRGYVQVRLLKVYMYYCGHPGGRRTADLGGRWAGGHSGGRRTGGQPGGRYATGGNTYMLTLRERVDTGGAPLGRQGPSGRQGECSANRGKSKNRVKWGKIPGKGLRKRDETASSRGRACEAPG
jgi:hypothetical protein